jgi:hypothetical protein
MQRLGLLAVILLLVAGGAALWLVSTPSDTTSRPVVDPVASPETTRTPVVETAPRTSEPAESVPEASPTEIDSRASERSSVSTAPIYQSWLRGNVYSGNAGGIGGARVRAALKLGDTWQEVASGTTNQDGTYALEADALSGMDEVLPGPEIWVYFQADGHQDSSQRAVRDTRNKGTWQASARLLPGACLVGRVVDATGAPVAAAEVNYEIVAEANGLPTPTLRLGPKPQRSDEHGQFRLGVPEGHISKVIARKLSRGYVESAIDQDVKQADVQVGDLALHALEHLSGRVVYPDGKPARGLGLLAQQTIDLTQPRPSPDLARGGSAQPLTRWSSRTRTGEDGHFAFDDLQPGAYSIIEQDLDVIGVPQRGAGPLRQTWGATEPGTPIHTGRSDVELVTEATRFELEVVRSADPASQGKAWVAIVPKAQLEATLTRVPPPTGSIVSLGQKVWFRTGPQAEVVVIGWECGKGGDRGALATQAITAPQSGEQSVRLELPQR